VTLPRRRRLPACHDRRWSRIGPPCGPGLEVPVVIAPPRVAGRSPSIPRSAPGAANALHDADQDEDSKGDECSDHHPGGSPGAGGRDPGPVWSPVEPKPITLWSERQLHLHRKWVAAHDPSGGDVQADLAARFDDDVLDGIRVLVGVAPGPGRQGQAQP
jgi:hypothetical protein